MNGWTADLPRIHGHYWVCVPGFGRGRTSALLHLHPLGLTVQFHHRVDARDRTERYED